MLKEHPRISVIVPVYNTKEYLSQCLDSLLCQTLKDIEIIIIDDGSTDGSDQLCELYASKDKRIKVLHKQNMGLSAARNYGLEIAVADYVMFVDSDDWVEPNFCETPYRIAVETETELIVFLRVWHDKECVKNQPCFPNEGFALKKEVLTQWWQITGEIVWNKLYHRRMFEEIRFPIGRLSEDTAVTYHLIQKANKVYLLNSFLYHHRENREGSIIYDKSIKLYKDQMYFNYIRIRDLKKWGYADDNEEIKMALLYFMSIGREGEISDLCQETLKNSLNFTGSLKCKAMLKIYHISPKLFDVLSVLTGKRIKQ